MTAPHELLDGLRERIEAGLNMFGAGWCFSAAIAAIDRRKAWWASILVSVGAANLWAALR